MFSPCFPFLNTLLICFLYAGDNFIAWITVNPHGESIILNSLSNSTYFFDFPSLFSLFCCLSSPYHFLSPSFKVGQSGTKCPIPPHLLHLFFFLFPSNAFLIASILLFPVIITSSSLSSSNNSNSFLDSEFNLLLSFSANLSIFRCWKLSVLFLLVFVPAFPYFWLLVDIG